MEYVKIKSIKNNVGVGAGPVSAQKGITLISLVVTIIVLLILAGVTINLTLGDNGIFTTAQKAAKNYTQAEQQELAELSDFEDQMNQYIETSSHRGVVHNDAIYKVASYNAETNKYTYKELKAGEKFPEIVSNGDVYVYGDYEYRYNQYYNENDDGTWVDNTEQNGWGVNVLDRTKTSYGEILISINEKYTTSLRKTFLICKQLLEAPAIPSEVKDMTYTFGGCSKLTKAPTIPSSVEIMNSTFVNCTMLENAPTIPNGVKSMSNTFNKCSSLVSVSKIPETVNNMKATFSGCTALISVENIPNGVTDLNQTFKNCSALINAPVIPVNVTVMYQTFYYCTSLTGTIEINANPTTYSSCFAGVNFAKQGVSLIGDSQVLDELGATGSNYSSSTI